MRKYIIIILNQMSIKLQYRFDTIIGLISKLVQLAMTFFIWNGLFLSVNNSQIAGYTRSQMLIYILLTNFTGLLFTFEHVFRLGNLVRSGKLTTHLLRPISFISESFANFIGSKSFLLLFYFLGLIFGLVNGYFKSFPYFLLIVIYLIFVVLMFFYLLSFISTIGFWLVQIWPLRPILSAIYLLFAGIYFPLDILPSSIFNILQYNPFALVGFISTRIIQGVYSEIDILHYLFVSVIWLVLFKFGYQILFDKGLKKYEGMGA